MSSAPEGTAHTRGHPPKFRSKQLCGAPHQHMCLVSRICERLRPCREAQPRSEEPVVMAEPAPALRTTRQARAKGPNLTHFTR
eukprot:scaffold8264_cov109-Isochrysis_galbana.AAC.10